MKKYINIEINKSIIYRENKNKTGIFRWVNNIDGKSYVGSSLNISKRLSTYFSKEAITKVLSISNSHIYEAILNHGYAMFSLYILEYCEKNVLIERKQFYYDKIKPEYNILKVPYSRLGIKHTLDSRLKMSLKAHGVKVKVFDKLNNLVYVFPTITGTAKHFNTSRRSISRHLDKSKLYKGFILKS